MRRGLVVRVRLDSIEGSEQGGTRPVIVISPTYMNERATVVLVAPITSQKMLRVNPFEAELDHVSCGLPQSSKAMLNQTRAIDKRRIVGTYGAADDETMVRIDAAILIATGLKRL